MQRIPSILILINHISSYLRWWIFYFTAWKSHEITLTSTGWTHFFQYLGSWSFGEVFEWCRWKEWSSSVNEIQLWGWYRLVKYFSQLLYSFYMIFPDGQKKTCSKESYCFFSTCFQFYQTEELIAQLTGARCWGSSCPDWIVVLPCGKMSISKLLIWVGPLNRQHITRITMHSQTSLSSCREKETVWSDSPAAHADPNVK